jgi:threonylcarbamoyladenosine tRNA methylthiotransferase MtaB
VKIALSTLGCKVNQTESASIEGLLKNFGYEIVPFTEKADIYIINTCTVTSKSDYQSRQAIRKAHKEGGHIIVTGCYAELRPDEVKSIEGVDSVLKNAEKNRILDSILKLEKKTSPSEASINTGEHSLHLYYSSTRSRAFLKVQDGCNSNCAYCTVPLARGKSRSLEMNHVLKAFDILTDDKGYKEIVLTGIHIGRYGEDLRPKSSLFELVQAIAHKKKSVRLRLSSIEPEEFNLSFLSLIQGGLICSHLHFPLQSGSDSVLRAMKRQGSSGCFKELILTIYNKIPDIALGTDLITGLPGETEDDFSKTYNIVNELPLSYFHVFPFSPRPGTKAATMKNQNPPSIIKERAKILRALSQKKHREYSTRFIHRNLDVIIEDKVHNTSYAKGISENYLKVLLPAHKIIAGERIKVHVIGREHDSLICAPCRK